MILERYPEIQALSAEEKLLLSDELQDAAMGIPEDPRRDAAILELLEERGRKYEADPSTGMTLEEFQARFEEHKQAYRESRK